MAGLPGCEMTQDGNSEKTVRFQVDQFDAVAEIVKPHRRPQLSDEQRAELRDRMVRINERMPRKSLVLARETHAEAST